MGTIANVLCHTVADTERTAAHLASLVHAGDIIALSGNLGAGKTTFARSFVHAWTNTKDDVPSPTFTLVQTYSTANSALWHCDLYRLSKPEDAIELGLEEAFVEAICLIEWPERLGQLLPARSLRVTMSFEATSPSTRHIHFEGSEAWAARLKASGHF